MRSLSIERFLRGLRVTGGTDSKQAGDVTLNRRLTYVEACGDS